MFFCSRFKRGVPDDRKIWSATAIINEKYHDILKDVHNSFLDAGSMAVTTNSYGIIPGVGFNLKQIEQYVTLSGKIARDCVDTHNDKNKTKKLVFGSLGPLLESYRPDKLLPYKQGVQIYQTMIHSLHPYVDCFLAETMSCLEESSQVLEACAKQNYKNKPLLVSYTLRSDGKLRNGESVATCIDQLFTLSSQQNVQCMYRTIYTTLFNMILFLILYSTYAKILSFRSIVSFPFGFVCFLFVQNKLVLAILFNCAEPEAITLALDEVYSNKSIIHNKDCLSGRPKFLLGAYANRLTPIASDWSMEKSESAQPMRTDLSPQNYWEDHVSTWIQKYNLQIIGGCCGITPQHISFIKNHHHQIMNEK